MRQRRQAERGHFTRVDHEHQRSRQEAERRNQRLLIVAAAVVLVALAAILLAGYYSSIFRPPRRIVAEVGDTQIRLKEVAAYTNLFFLTGGLDTQNLALLPEQVFQTLVRYEVLRQGAPLTLGVGVSPEEVEQQLVFTFEPPSDDEEAPVPSVLSEAGQEQYQFFRDQTGISDTQYRRLIEGQLLEARVSDRIGTFVPESTEQVFLHWIVVASATQGETVKERLDNGEEFAAVARELNQDRAWSDENGEVGWIPRTIFPELDGAIFSLEPGEHVGPLDTSFGVVVAQVTEGPQEEELAEEFRAQIRDQSTAVWFQEQALLLVDLDRTVFDNSDRDWVLDRLDFNTGQVVIHGG